MPLLAPPSAPQSKLAFALLCAWVLGISGCFTKQAPAAHLATIRFGPPNVPAAAPASLIDSPPQITEEAQQWPQLVAGRSAPPRPRATPQPAPEPAHAEKSPEPTIAPEVPTAEMIASRNETEHSLDLAEKNLSFASGKNLNAMQQDLVSKVSGFSDGAKEAMKAGDWVRAKNLSKKAEVLSDQLASSL
jgi:hypothetical protein